MDALKIQVLFSALDKLSGPLRGISGASKSAQSALAATRKEVLSLQKAQGRVGQFKAAERGFAQTAKDMAIARNRAEALRKELDKLGLENRELARDAAAAGNFGKAYVKVAKDLDKLEAAEKKAAAAHELQGRKVQELGRKLEAAGADVADLARYEDRLGHQTYEANKRLEQQRAALDRISKAQARVDRAQALGGKMRSAGTSMVFGGMAMAAPMIAAGKSAMDFESQLTDIGQKAEMSRRQVAAMGREFDKMGPAVAQLPSELAKGVDTLMGFGLGEKQAMDAIRPIGMAATAYKAEVTDLAAATFSSLDNLKVHSKDTARSLDIMAAAGKAGAFEMKDMAQYFPALTASANALGQKGVPAVADLAAALQITRKGAGDASTAANNLQNLLNKVTAKPTIDSFKKMGVDLPAALKRAAADGKSPIEAITELTRKATGGDLSKLSYLFPDAQVQAALRPLVQNIDLYRQIRADALKAQGSVEADFNERMKDGAARWQKMQARAQALAHVVGSALVPAAGDLFDRLGGIADRVTAWAQRNPQLVQTLAKIAAGIAVMLVVFGTLAVVVGAVIGPFALLRFGLMQAVPALRIFVPLLHALRWATLLLASGIVKAGAMMLANPLLLVVAGIALAAYLIYANWDKIKRAFSDGVANASARVDQLKRALGTVWNEIVAGFTRAGARLGAAWEWVKSAFMAGVSFFRSLPGQMLSIGAQIIQGLINGITGRLSALKGTIVIAATSAATWFKSKLGIRSPSRVFFGFGGHITDGLSRGIAAGEGAAVSTVDRLSRRIAGAFAAGSLVATPALARLPEPAAVATASRSAVSAPSAPAAAGPVASRHFEIHVHQLPGQDSQDLARAVADEIDRRENRRAAATRSDYADD